MNKQTYRTLVTAALPNIPSGSSFRLSNLIPNPQAHVGTFFFMDVDGGYYPDVQHLTSDNISEIYLNL